jgi:hypothetical protein
MKAAVFLSLSSLIVSAAEKLPVPPPLGVPSPAPATDKPYAPQPILPGGVVMTLYPENSPFLNPDKIKQAEVYSVSKSRPGPNQLDHEHPQSLHRISYCRWQPQYRNHRDSLRRRRAQHAERRH